MMVSIYEVLHAIKISS